MKNILWIVVECARTEKTVARLPLATPATARRARLPFLDRLRELGTTWTDACAISSTTAPNFGTMFTGLTPGEHGIVEPSHRALNDIPTLAEILQERGWYTYAEVTGPLIPESGLDRGFDHYRCRGPAETLTGGFAERLDSLRSSLREPWFLCVHVSEPHPPDEHDRTLALVDYHLEQLFATLDLERTTVVYAGNHGERLTVDYDLNRELGGDDFEVLRAWRTFVESHPEPIDPDTRFRFLRDRLGDATARIYGYQFLGHGFHVSDDLVRVPLVIVDEDRCLPGDALGGIRSQLDLFSTTLDLCDVTLAEPRASLERSILSGPEPEMIYLEANGNGGRAGAGRCYVRGARSRTWKYWRLEGGDEPHRILWNLEHDPRETRDVSTAHPDVVERMDRFVSEMVARPPVGAPAEPTPSETARLQNTMRTLGYL
jgi:arylsulfatase A-like enzyme